MCIWVFVRGGVSGTSFLLFLHLFFAGVLCTCVSMHSPLPTFLTLGGYTCYYCCMLSSPHGYYLVSNLLGTSIPTSFNVLNELLITHNCIFSNRIQVRYKVLPLLLIRTKIHNQNDHQIKEQTIHTSCHQSSSEVQKVWCIPTE